MTTQTHTHSHIHTHTLYIIIDYVMPPMHRFITCTKFVTMKIFDFSFLTRAYVFLTGSQKVSRKDNACSSLPSFPLRFFFFFFFFYRHLLR